jgi:hypothetical protein
LQRNSYGKEMCPGAVVHDLENLRPAGHLVQHYSLHNQNAAPLVPRSITIKFYTFYSSAIFSFCNLLYYVTSAVDY